MTYREAVRYFRAHVRPDVDRRYPGANGHPDKPARREAWVNWTDGLHRDGQITDRQAQTWDQPEK